MKKIIALLTIISFTTLQAQTVWTLEDCLQYAKEHNYDILKQKFQNQINLEDKTIAKGNYFPDLSFTATQGFNLGNSFNVSTGVGQLESSFNSFSLSSNVTFFNGFKNKYNLQKTKLALEKGQVDFEKLFFDLSVEIINKYLQVLFNKEIYKLTQEQLQISEAEVNRLRQLVKNGLKPKKELLEIEATYATNYKEKIIAKNNINNSLIELTTLLDVNKMEGFDVSQVETNQLQQNNAIFSPQQIDTIAENTPHIQSLLLDYRIKEQDVKIEKTNFYPQVSLSYSYNTNYYHIIGQEDRVFNQETGIFEDNGFLIQIQNNLTHYIGLIVTVPIFNKFSVQSNLDKAKIQSQIISLELDNQKKEIKNQIEIATNDAISAKATLEAAHKAYDSQKEAFLINQKKFREGIITSDVFLESKLNYTQTQTELIKAKYDYIFKTKILSILIK